MIHYSRLSETDENRGIIAKTYSSMRTVSFRLRYREQEKLTVLNPSEKQRFPRTTHFVQTWSMEISKGQLQNPKFC